MKTIGIPWDYVADPNTKWNLLCADIVEHFGLPGDRYTSMPTEAEMTIEFKNEKDALLCKIMLSEHLGH